MGAPALDKFFDNFPDRVINVGIAEQSMVGTAAGLALSGKKVFCYSIAPFITGRVYEQIKLDLCVMKLPVILLGVGSGYSYNNMGPTHHSVDDISILRTLPNLDIYSVSENNIAYQLAYTAVNSNTPQYIRFDRECNHIYDYIAPDIYKGFYIHNYNYESNTFIITMGAMLPNSLEASKLVKTKYDLNIPVVDVYKLKPLNIDELLKSLEGVKHIITVEEHFLSGGLGSIILEFISDNNLNILVTRIGQKENFVFQNGSRQDIWDLYNINTKSIYNTILKVKKA